MTGVDLEEARDVAIRAAELAIEVLRSTPLGEVRTKQHAADVVTDVDTATEQAVRDHVARAYPAHRFVGEEHGGTADDGPTWYCDPVDGTTNLASRLPWTSFSLALAVGHDPLVGVVADPWRGEVLHAVRGGGAYRRRVGGPGDTDITGDTHVRVADRDSLAGGVVMSEWAAHVPWPGMTELLAALGERHCTMRVMGSGTLSVASVAAGRSAGSVIGEFHPEDHLAAMLLCRESGAVLRDSTGSDAPWAAPGPFVAAAPGVADVLAGLVRAATGPR